MFSGKTGLEPLLDELRIIADWAFTSDTVSPGTFGMPGSLLETYYGQIHEFMRRAHLQDDSIVQIAKYLQGLQPVITLHADEWTKSDVLEALDSEIKLVTNLAMESSPFRVGYITLAFRYALTKGLISLNEVEIQNFNTVMRPIRVRAQDPVFRDDA